MTRIKDKCVLITGAGSGIGRIMGRLALERGARKVVVWDINEQNIAAIQQKMSADAQNGVAITLNALSQDKALESQAIAERTLTVKQNELVAEQLLLALKQGNAEAVLQAVNQIVRGPNGLVAQNYIKTDVNGRVAGYGLYNDGNVSEFAILANRFFIAKADGTITPIFEVDSETGLVQIIGDLIASGAITGDKINAAAQIQLGAGGQLIMGVGSIFQMGSGAISIDSETGVLQIRDPNNLTTGNYIRVETGDITTYQYLNGAYRPMRSLRVLETGEATNGERKYLTSLFPSAPQITVSIRDMVVFDPQYVGNKQRIRCLAQDIQYNAATGQASFMPSCILSLIGVVSNIVPPNNEPEAGVSIGDLGRVYITQPVDETYMLYPHTEFELLPGVEEVKINANIYAQIQTGREGSDWHPAYKMYYELYLYLVIGENEYLLGSTTYNCTLQKLDEYLSSHGATFESSAQTATGKITNITGTVDVPSTASLSTASNSRKTRSWLS